jgi:hypothetical protein
MSYSRAGRGYTKPPPGSMIDLGHPMSRGLVGRWLINEGAGSSLLNVVRGDVGTLTGMDPATDWVGSSRGFCLDFDGSDDCVVIGTLPLPRDGWTLVVDCKPASTGSSVGGALGLGDSSGIPDGAIVPNRDGTVQVYQANIYIDSGVPTTTNWTHISLSRVSAAEGYMSVNGIMFAANPTNTSNDVMSFNMGRWSAAVAAYWAGQIRDVSVYNRVLSSKEILSLYNDPYSNILVPQYRRYFIPAAGGNLKTINDLVKASVKTFYGLAVAAVKTVDGLA